MKILFINPPSFYEILGNNPKIVEEERGFNPPLGILYIATVLKQNGYDVSIIDAQVNELSYEELFSQISSIKPDVIGITVMTFTLLDVIRVVKWVRENMHNTKIILGGPHIHLFPTETMHLLDIDFLIMGEGEESVLKLINNLTNKQEYKNIPGLVFKENGDIRFGPSPSLIQNLDAIPHPDRRLLPYTKYSSILSCETPITTMFTSRGCPYKCRFCDRPHLGKHFRAHSAKYVVEEMKMCEDLGIKEILIYDDTFTIDRKRTLDICKLYRDYGLSVKWDIRARVNTIDEEVIIALKGANCQRIHFGVEAGTHKILKVLNKGITLDEAINAFQLCKKYGIETLAYFMIGSPNETIDNIMETFRFAIKLNPDYLHLTILTPFPGTEIYYMGINKGLFNDFWREFAMNPDYNFKPKFWDEILSEDKLKALIIKGYREFYFRPYYIIKRLIKLKNMYELFKKARAAIKLLKWKN